MNWARALLPNSGKIFFLIEEKLFTVIEQIYEHLNELFLLKEFYF